jgi:N-acetylmuramoyl-L-alanine amidase
VKQLSHRPLRASVAALALLAVAHAYAAVHKSASWADTQFSAAGEAHQRLEARPISERTRHDYERVITAYQRVYAEAPTSPKADPSVMAGAELLEEMGRQFKDEVILRSAISEYQFLRREYPGSKSRIGALYRIGEIYHDDLHDKAEADATFQEFLEHYPNHPLAVEARRQLKGKEPAPQQTANVHGPPQVKKPSQQETLLPTPVSVPHKTADPEMADPRTTDQGKDKDQDENENQSADSTSPAKDTASAPPPIGGQIAHVLAIRHWSTPDSTRVAIDLDRSLNYYETQRIDNPDRLFFDLYGTRLAHSLSTKSVEVDDGFLKKIRVSQYESQRARIVLDLDDLTDYRVSLESNPWRLLVDIHNKKVGATQAVKSVSSQPSPADAPATEPSTAEINPAASEPVPARPALAKTPCNQPGHGDPSKDDDTVDCEASAASKAADTARDDANLDAPVLAKPASPAKRTTVDSHGVKKTIVDADDDTSIHTVAKLDQPDLPPAIQTATPDVQPPPPEPVSKKSKKKAKQKSTQDVSDIRVAQPTASGDRSLTRALGLKINKIVIDPGHGGHDTGTIGPHGLEEKDLVLDVSLRLGKLLASRLGSEIVFTRTDDTFIPLESRTAIANHEGADLFISVHANSSPDPDARGTETYYLNFTSSSDALEVAARENAVSDKSIHELQDLVKKIALKEKIEESQEFASDVESSLNSGLSTKNPGLRDRGVKKAPFIVLIGANMPSILAEISFVSNPDDERRLKTAEYRQKIAESLYRGVARYVNGLSGVKLASKIDKSEGQ